MRKAWPRVKLGEVLVQDQRYINAPEPREYPKLSVKLYGKGVVLDASVDGSTLKMQRHQIARAGQVILSEIWGKKGAIGFVPDEGDGALCTSHFFLFDVVPERVERGWLQALFTANYLEPQLGADAKGTTGYAAVRPKALFNCEVPLPPLAEQRRIAKRLRECESATQSAKRLQSEIETERAALTISVHSTLSCGRVVSLGEVLELHEESVQIEPEGEYPQIGIKSFGGGLFKKPAVTAGQTTYRAFNSVYSGAIVLSQVKAWEGAVAVATPDVVGGYLSPEYRTFRCKPGQAHPEYLRALVGTEWFWRQLTTATRGVGARRERTRPEQFLTLTMPMPSFDGQVRGIKIFSELQRARAEGERSRASLDAVVPALLNRTFDGGDQRAQHE